MNKQDLFVTGRDNIIIINIQKKEIIKYVELKRRGFLSSMYKLSNKFILLGLWHNNIEQLEYDEIKKEFKTIQKTNHIECKEIFAISSISIFKNKLIVTPYNNQLGNSSLIVYQLKNK